MVAREGARVEARVVVWTVAVETAEAGKGVEMERAEREVVWTEKVEGSVAETEVARVVAETAVVETEAALEERDRAGVV